MKLSTTAFAVIFTLIVLSFSNKSIAQDEQYYYAYLSIHGKLFSKKLNVDVDFGDTPEQIEESSKYTEILSEKKSYAAVLNYMVDLHYELVETMDYTYITQGTGGTSGIAFIMRKKK